MSPKKTILFFSLMFSLTNISFAQVWPFTPMIRFGNAVYIDTDQEKLSELGKEMIILEKGMEDRYFDVLVSGDSLEIEMDGKPVVFFQKSRREPKSRKNILFYSRRKLINKDHKVIYLKLQEIKGGQILAEATLKNEASNPSKEKKLVHIDIEDLDGLFLGPKKGVRTTTTILSLGGTAALLLLL